MIFVYVYENIYTICHTTRRKQLKQIKSRKKYLKQNS